MLLNILRWGSINVPIFIMVPQEIIISGNGHTTKLVANILGVRCDFEIGLTLVEIKSILVISTRVNPILGHAVHLKRLRPKLLWDNYRKLILIM